MMSVEEYAIDINRKVEEILKKCKELNIKAFTAADLLDDEAITELDNVINNETSEDEELEDIAEELAIDIAKTEKIDIDNSINKQKLKKKTTGTLNQIKNTQKDLANKKKELYKSKEKLMTNETLQNDNIVLYKEGMSVGELAARLNVSGAEIIKKLFMLGIMANVNNTISYENAEVLVLDYKKELKKEETLDVTNFEEYEIVDSNDNLVKRPPVVTIMGHVDHGKTTLLDTIRKSHVADKEAGGITQAISAYQITYKNEPITFIDTPGHAAFTEMRSRGASITDIIIIIVAADDGVMPQTKEAIDHALAAKVPIMVAINKIDKPGSNIDRIKSELSEYGLIPEEYGGDTLYNEISAKNEIGIDELLDNILLIAEMQDYKANPSRYAVGTVIESRLDKQVGPIVTLLIGNGTLRIGDPIVVGVAYGKVRTLKNDLGVEIASSGPSRPVEITGLNETPMAGDKFMAFESEKKARSIGEQRKQIQRSKSNVSCDVVTLDDLFSKISSGLKEINVIVKADVNGSAEAIKNSLEKLIVEEVRVKVIRSSVGAITESDVILARASNAILIGFNVKPNNTIKEYAKENCVEIRLYSIIYKIVEEMESAMKGLLEPIYEEKITGSAEVRQLFKFSKVGIIAGSYITDGIIKKTSKVRVFRDSKVVFEGNIGTIQREKDQAKEVKKGLECGITIEDFVDFNIGDKLEAYELIEIKR